jgi:predicted ATP-binding protein involved in virulence
MLIHFHISGFRGMPDTEIDIARRTAIIGANGSGKTHILEGLHLASGGHLHYFHAPRGESAHFELTYMEPIGPKKYTLDRSEGKDRYNLQ